MATREMRSGKARVSWTGLFSEAKPGNKISISKWFLKGKLIFRVSIGYTLEEKRLLRPVSLSKVFNGRPSRHERRIQDQRPDC
jgi:hypothetical protein